ncbi:MAG: O-antigen ligase family protein [Elusimicrobia bacterium]|nr:O-antigen ligase family protein [Elusimicrobiota bacterium]
MTNKIAFICVKLIVFLTPIIFYTGTKDNFLIKETVFGVFGLLLALILILKIFQGKQRIKNTWLGLLLILYLITIIISAINAVHIQLVFEYLFFWVILTSVYLSVKRFSKKEFVNILNTLAVTTLVVIVYGTLQYFKLDPINWFYGFDGRSSSSFGNPNFFSGYLLLVFPLFFARMISTRESVKHSFWMIFCFLIVFNIGVAKTRGAWLAFFLTVLVLIIGQMVYLKLKFNSIYRMIRGSFWFFLLFFAIFLISIDRLDTLKGFFSRNDASINERIFKWKTGWEMIKEHPVFGVGAGNLKVNFANYQAKVTRDIQLKGTSESNLHNEFLQIFAETGITGLLVFLAVFLYFFYYCGRLLYRKSKEEEYEFNMILGILAGVFSVFVYALTNFPFSVVPVISTVFVFFGFAELHWTNFDQSEYEPKHLARKHTSPSASIILFVVYVLLVGYTVIPRFIGDRARRNGDIAVQEDDLKTAMDEYEKSIKLDYYHSDRTAYDLGEVYRKLDRYDKAIESYKISVDLRNYGEVYNNIGNCYYIKGDFKNALANWNIAVQLGLPKDSDQKITLSNIRKLTYRMKTGKR